MCGAVAGRAGDVVGRDAVRGSEGFLRTWGRGSGRRRAAPGAEGSRSFVGPLLRLSKGCG